MSDEHVSLIPESDDVSTSDRESLGAPSTAGADPKDEEAGALDSDAARPTQGEFGSASEERPIRYWKIGLGPRARWEAWREGGYVAIDWPELGDLTEVDAEGFERRMASEVDYYEVAVPDGARQVWTFAKEIRPGDRVAVNRGASEVLGLGVVTGPYVYADEAETDRHRIAVSWTDTHRRRVSKPGWRRTLLELSETEYRQIDAAGRADAGLAVIHMTEPPEGQGVYPIEAMADRTGRPAAVLRRWVDALERRGQVVLYGPPGAGKSDLARHLARHAIGGGEGIVETVVFHPAMTYETFVSGSKAGDRDGLFTAFCRRAASCAGRCVFVVEGIDRAEPGTVFGEVLHLLDGRERALRLSSGAMLAVPSGVRLIATMSTADRSPSDLEAVVLSRFAWIHVAPDPDLLRRTRSELGYDPTRLLDLLENVNRAIGDPLRAVSPLRFLRPELDRHLEGIWTMEVEPYLTRVLADRPDVLETFRWEVVRDRLTG